MTEDGAPDGEIATLQRWVAAHCDGDREHRHGVTIETLDNPGWRVRIDLAETALPDVPFEPIREGLVYVPQPRASTPYVPDAEVWIHCTVRDGRFEGAGDLSQLARILRVFLDWAHRHDARGREGAVWPDGSR